MTAANSERIFRWIPTYTDDRWHTAAHSTAEQSDNLQLAPLIMRELIPVRVENGQDVDGGSWITVIG
jgi:hypothetical protein